MIINGKAIAEEITQKICREVGTLPRRPNLAIVWAGNNEASRIYVHLKVKKARELGIDVEVTANFAKVSPRADGIIVQLPHPCAEEIISQIPPGKDIDGLRPDSPFLPATVKGILKILEKLNLLKSHKVFAVVGQGKLVGKPLADYLESHNHSVLRADKNTTDLALVVSRADVLITATGVADLITPAMVKPGAVLIDCGSPRPEVKADCYALAGAYTPVPGGVGPMTVVCLLENLLEAVKMQA